MGIRPPQSDGVGDPDTVEFGIVAFDGLLSEADLTFPTDRDQVRATLAGRSIAVDPAGREVPVDDVLADLDDRTYESEGDLKNALHPIFEQRREEGVDLLARVRSWLGL
ncbi:hypothetical protein [Halococcoides cellulosivorans]|uniref:Uncharacterized protein n=1 Tax=Halococcoides cellulosivorans TaxID=1679096 RepID=A0A2R4X1M4_9EURY|nr:hypothetical protein [Halococcoides cellulosivorans]AWB27633.1 hypothetical protein HARCEL1_07885 [Halococcoides cellulosivorans]